MAFRHRRRGETRMAEVEFAGCVLWFENWARMNQGHPSADYFQVCRRLGVSDEELLYLLLKYPHDTI